ncbi:uncharacterized protein LOC128677676 [Plodia interpunctella]|uniref:uncharacterized protein LOC128677676 n=1 Tax=Plodia interpunctella TaxID=58824 RepID=UPI0023680A2E|nr:uncharacterized protein LOC128677676 [Plodia interpunctella]
MDFRLVIFVCLFLAVVSAFPDERTPREKRDVMETIKSAWGEVVKTLSDAGDAVVHVFKPTEKSVLDKMADGVQGLTL